MSLVWQIAFVLGLLGGLLAAMAGLRYLAKALGWHPELQRKLIHMGAGGLACALPWVMSTDWQVWLLLGLTALAMLAMRTRLLGGIGQALHGVERRSWGDFLLVLSVALIFLLYQNVPVFYVLPLAILTWADAAAALAGVRYGRIFFATEDGQKSVEGSVVFFLVALILSMICLLLLTEIARGSVITVSLAVAVFATALEADSWDGFDNLFLPLGVFILLNTLIATDPGVLPLLIPLALACGYGIYALRRHLGSGRQVARVHGIAMFLLLCAVYPLNAILPGLALILPAWIIPSFRTGRPALAWVGGMALLSFFYFAFEGATGWTAINLYGLAMAALVTAAAGFAPATAVLRLITGSVTALICGAIWWVVTGSNPEDAFWHGEITIWALIWLVLVGLLAGALAPVFARRPALGLILLGSAAPNLFLIYTFLAGAP